MADGPKRSISTPAKPGTRAFHHSAFDGVADRGAYDLADLYRELLDHGELAGFEVQQRFYETGSFAGIQDLTEPLRQLHFDP